MIVIRIGLGFAERSRQGPTLPTHSHQQFSLSRTREREQTSNDIPLKVTVTKQVDSDVEIVSTRKNLEARFSKQSEDIPITAM
jgi:hypothetical protein